MNFLHLSLSFGSQSLSLSWFELLLLDLGLQTLHLFVLLLHQLGEFKQLNLHLIALVLRCLQVFLELLPQTLHESVHHLVTILFDLKLILNFTKLLLEAIISAVGIVFGLWGLDLQCHKLLILSLDQWIQVAIFLLQALDSLILLYKPTHDVLNAFKHLHHLLLFVSQVFLDLL